MNIAMGVASEDDKVTVLVNPRLSNQGVFAAEGEETKARFSFSKRM